MIGAMGDSASAGYGAIASTIFQAAVENRGVSWSGGGQGTWREFLTLPNILKVRITIGAFHNLRNAEKCLKFQ